VPDGKTTFRSLSRIESAALADPSLHRLVGSEKEDGGLTIFIPSWNHRPYLPRALSSAFSALEHLEKAGYPAEVLVVDDGSRDGTQKLLRGVQALYDEPRLKTLFLKRNLGLPRLRNLGLQMARFKYVCWLDADNELAPENLPAFVRSIMETEAALVHGNLITVSEGSPRHLKNNARVTMRISQHSHVDALALVDAEKLIRVGGYNPWFYSGSDWEMVLHLISEEERIVFVPLVLGRYHIHRMSMFREARPHMEEIQDSVYRMYSQSGTREWDPLQVGYTYHPETGYLDSPQEG
jgi:glycosyltransferase involved in cell wall biosynthesis